MIGKLSIEARAKLASAYAGFVFGLYWIPLRALEQAGFPGVWATVALNAVPMACVMPLILFRGRNLALASIRFHLGSMTLGIAYTLYASAFLFTQVVNVVILYYLLPIWGFVFARLVIGERVTLSRWISMAVGFGGIVTIFGFERGLPLPRNPGDWMALASGILWALGSLVILLDRKNTPIDFGCGFIFWGTIGATGVASIGTALGLNPTMDAGAVREVALWLIPVGLLLVLPGSFATIFGPTILNPGVVGLLFMTEISVGTTTAALLTDEPFGVRQVAGVLAISFAGLLEPILEMLKRRRRIGTS